MKWAILLLLVLSFSFAGELWKVDAGSGVDTQPLVYGSRVIVGTEGGKVYSIEPPFVKWSYNALSPIVSEPVSFGDKIIIATEAKIIALNQYGALQWEAELPGITSVAVSDKIYVADKNGVQALNADGTLAWNFVPGSEEETHSPSKITYIVTQPLATPSYVVFGYNDYIYAIRTTGAFFWKNQIGHMWDTSPTLVANTLYTGTSEGLLYGLDMFNGNVRSKVNVFEQISTTPVDYQGQIIIGTSNNNLYSIFENEIKWSLELDGKVTKKMYLSTSGGNDALYLTTTKSLYAVSATDGTLYFKKSFIDWPSPPNYLNGQIVLGTQDGSVYGIDSSKACSILYPEMDAQVGNAELTISGLGYSKSGNPTTQLRINEGTWISFNKTKWEYNLDPSGYPYGILTLECMVSDSTGSEAEPYSSLYLIHVSESPPELLSINYPSQVRTNTEFEITITDSRGVPLGGVIITAGGQKFSGDGTITLSLPPGPQNIKVSRAGYQTEEFLIDSKGDPILAYALGALFVIGLLAYVYFLFIRKKKKKELIIKEKHSEPSEPQGGDPPSV